MVASLTGFVVLCGLCLLNQEHFEEDSKVSPQLRKNTRQIILQTGLGLVILAFLILRSKTCYWFDDNGIYMYSFFIHTRAVFQLNKMRKSSREVSYIWTIETWAFCWKVSSCVVFCAIMLTFLTVCHLV